MIGLSDWYYRGDSGGICYCISRAKFCLSLPGKGIVCINSSQLDIGHSFLQDSPVFDMDYVSESVFEEIFASVLEERFPETESLTEHQRKALLAVINRHIANRTWKVNYISVAP